MPIHVLDLERDCLRVGNNQLLTQANAVYVGNTLNINNSIRFPAEQNVIAPGGDLTTSAGLRILLYPNTYGIGIESGTVWYASGGNHRWYSGGTSLGTFNTGGLNITVGANAVNFSNGTSNWIGWNQSGVAAPAVTTRSAGTKLVLYPNIGASSVDYAIGIEGSTMWFSVDNLGSQYRWYANTTQLMQLNGTSGLTQSVGNTNIRSGVFFVDGGAGRVNINSTANNEARFNAHDPTVIGTIATASLVDPATDLITTGTHGWANGQQVFIRSTATIPAGLTTEYVYHLCVRSTTTFTLHTTIAAALAGTGNVDITSAGSGTITAHPVSQIGSFYNGNGNANYLRILNYRNAAGADWTTTSTRLTQVVDVTHQGYVEFNPSGFTYGVALGSNQRNFLTMSNAGQFLFGNTTANNVMFAANGNVGVGNTAPTNKLRVEGDLSVLTTITSGNTTTNGYKTVTQDIYSRGMIRAAGWYTNTSASSATGLAVEIGTTGGAPFVHVYNRDASTYGPLTFHANSFTLATQGTQSGTTIANSSATHALFAANGNVGIGTTAPAGKLQITDTSAPNLRLHFSGAAAAGNKGILYFTHNRNSDSTQELLGYIQGIAEDNQSAGGMRFVARNNADVEVFKITSAGNFSMERDGSPGTPGTWPSSSPFTVTSWAADGPASDTSIALFTINAGRVNTTDTNAVNAYLMRMSADDGVNFWFKANGTAYVRSRLGIGTTPATSGIGITFPASENASSDPNTLDDYEEGTWTPELRDGATALTQAYTYRSGVYHKIGRMVHIHFGFLLSSLSGTGGNALRVYGLPFTGATTGGYQEPMGYAIFGNQPTAADANRIYFFAGSGAAYLEARTLTGGDSVWTSNNIDGDTFCKCSVIYWV